MEKSKLLSLLSFLESLSSTYQPLSKVDIVPSTPSVPYDLLNIYHGQTNLKENVTSSHYKQFLMPKPFNGQILKFANFPCAEGFPFISNSPKHTYKAVIQSFPNQVDKTKKRNTLEIYNQDSLYRSLNLDDFHESILNNDMVGRPLIWSPNENRLVYLAEMKPDKRTGYFDSYDMLDEKQLSQAEENFKYEPDYGEKLGNIRKIGIFVYDIKENTLNQLLMPYEKIFPTNPDFIDCEGTGLLFCGFISDPVKLGILHCINRTAKIFIEKQPKFKLLFPKKTQDKEEEKKNNEKVPDLTLKDLNVLIESYDTCIRPLISPDKKKLAYYGSPLKPPHLNTVALHVLDFETGKDECIIPIVKENLFQLKEFCEINKDLATFSGICGFYDVLDKIYWLSDSKHLVFQSITGFETDIFLANTEEKEVVKLTPKPSLRSSYWNILWKDPKKDILIASFKNMKDGLYPKIACLSNLNEILTLKTPMKEINMKAHWEFNEPNAIVNPLQSSLEGLFKEKFRETIFKQGKAEGLFWSLENYDSCSEKYYEYFTSDKKPESDNTPHLKPLIVSVHGGPHGNCSGFSLLRMLFLLKGYNMLIPNFTGSCGYGQDFIENLMGKIGEIDVEETIGMIKQVIDKKLCDPEKIIIVGGSYGGYLSGIMATHPKYSSIFKGAILLNPVVNIPFLHSISDIPEWGPAVSLSKKDWWSLTPEEVKLMYAQSPISKPCNIPCLLLLGSKDRRVPYQGGLAFNNKTLLEGGKIETFVYESDHALADNPKMDYDVSVKILSFISRIFKE